MKLRLLRTVSAILIVVLLTLYFLDVSGWMPAGFDFLAAVQFVPALLAGSVGILVFLLVMTLLFGRIYCSVICPLGVYMDFVTWVRKRFKPKMKYRFSPEKKALRWGVSAVVVVSYFLGLTVVLSLLDPYSLFGRMATNLFRPVYLAGYNVLTGLFNSGDEMLYLRPVILYGITSFIVALLTLVIIGLLAARYGRIWCNTICPVGTVLGFLSKFSLYKIRINQSTCISCGMCERACKSSCIHNKNMTVDHSRCVTCFDCLETCKFDSIRYGLPRKSDNSTPAPSEGQRRAAVMRKTRAGETKSHSVQFEVAQGEAVQGVVVGDETVRPEAVVDESKRRFLGALATTAVAAGTSLPALSMARQLSVPAGRVQYKKQYPLSPPGSISHEHLLSRCTACHLCIAKCPYDVLKPTFLKYGVEGFMQPTMQFNHGYCEYDCTICSDVCPSEALISLTVEAKHKLQMGRVVFIEPNCVVVTDGTFCGHCAEVCPTIAIEMVPYGDGANGLTIPVTFPDRCVGCGGCEYVCPAVPIKAMQVEGNPVHGEAVGYY